MSGPILDPGQENKQSATEMLQAVSTSSMRYSRWKRFKLRRSANWRQIRMNWSIFRQNSLAMTGLGLITLFAVMAMLHPILMNHVWNYQIYNPITGFDIAYAPHPSPPSRDHLLGTEAMGKDVLSLLLASTTPTFILGLTAALTTALLGTLFGLIYGMLTGLSSAAIVLRSHALAIMARPFITASRVAGAGGWYIVRKHLVPHMLPLAALYMMLAVTGVVVADGFISFFGFSRGHQNWGNMIYNAFAYANALNTDIQWHVLIPPAMAISLFAAAFYFVGRGMQEVTDPHLRKV